MLPDEIEFFLLGEIAVNRTLDRLMERIFHDADPHEAREALRLIATALDKVPQSFDALRYYRGMRWALNEDEFRRDAPLAIQKQEWRLLRKKRLIQYSQYRELFELEIDLARAIRRSGMALLQDWSWLNQDLLEGAAILRQRLLLRLGGVLFRLNLPGGLDCCDSAVFQMLRLIYLRAPSPAA